MDVERIAAAREVVIVAEADRSSTIRAVDGTSVGVEPGAYGFEGFDGCFGNGAVGFWADIEEVVAALLRAGGEVVDDALWRFPFVIVELEAPTVVHGVAGLPGALGGFDFVLRC